MNKKIISFLGFLSVLILLISGCAQQAKGDDSLKKVKDKKELVVATSGTLWCRISYL